MSKATESFQPMCFSLASLAYAYFHVATGAAYVEVFQNEISLGELCFEKEKDFSFSEAPMDLPYQ